MYVHIQKSRRCQNIYTKCGFRVKSDIAGKYIRIYIHTRMCDYKHLYIYIYLSIHASSRVSKYVNLFIYGSSAVAL